MSSYNLQIEIVEASESGAIIKLTGELDQLTVRDLKIKLQEIGAEKLPKMVFNMEAVEFMASAGLSIFAFYHELYRNNGTGQKLSLINCPESIMRVLKITKMDEVLDLS